MILPVEKTTLICPTNDLESITILEIARRYGVDVIEVPGDWGTKLTPGIIPSSKIGTLRENVVIVELPGEEIEETLRAEGKRVFRVDHHEYGGQETQESSRASSLEQFARLIGHELTREEWEVAINDRDFLPGLSKAGVSYGRAMHIRQQELAIRRQEANMEEAIAYIKKHARKLDDLRFALVPQRLSGVMLEAAQYPACQEYEKAAVEMRAVALEPTLILFHADDDREKIVGLNFAGPVKERSWLTSILNEPAYVADFDMWRGGGQYGCFFGAKVRANQPGPAVNDLVSHLLENLLITGRPLRRYTCNFHLPLDLMLDSDIGRDSWQFDRVSNKFAEQHYINLGTTPDKGENENSIEAQAYHFFLPHLRSFIYETRADSSHGVPDKKSENFKPTQHWRLNDTQKMEVALARKGKEHDDPPIVAQLSEVALYRYFNGLYCLAIRVDLPALENSSLNEDGDGWWRDLFYANDEQFKDIRDRRQAAEWLRYTKLVRLLYHTFPEQVDEGKIDDVALIISQGGQDRKIAFNTKTRSLRLPYHIGEEVSPVVMELLARFFARSEDGIEAVKTELEKRLDHIPDDRMYVNVAYGLAGPAPRLRDENAWNQHERLFSLALFVDTTADGLDALNSWVYDEKFTRKQVDEFGLNRWRGLGTRSGYTVYSNVHLGYGWFFNNIIAPGHVPYVYGRMLLLALFYQASLRHYQRWVTLATEKLIGKERKLGSVDLRDTRQKFIEFTNNYWFREITYHIQGREIFAKQVAALELKEEYDLIKDEMERADEFLESKYARDMNLDMNFLTWIGGGFAFFSLVLTSMQIEVGKIEAWMPISTFVVCILVACIAWSFRDRSKR